VEILSDQRFVFWRTLFFLSVLTSMLSAPPSLHKLREVDLLVLLVLLDLRALLGRLDLRGPQVPQDLLVLLGRLALSDPRVP
jgi:hypothetical protein